MRSESSAQIIEYAREHGRVSIGDMMKLTGVSRNTLKEHFRNLVAKKYPEIKGGGSNQAVYFALAGLIFFRGGSLRLPA